MKRVFFLIFALLGFLFLTFSCGGGGKQEAAFLCRLDSLVEADADSALRLMGRMQSEGWPRRDAMRLELLRAKAMNRADSLFTTDSLMFRVAEYYRSHGSQNDRMLSLYLLGCTYRDMGAAPRAIETWQKAVNEADTTRQDCDLSTLMRIHSQMADIYNKQRLYDYMQKEDSIAATLCLKMKDTLNALIMEEKKCALLFEEGNYEECIKATEQVYKQYLQSSFKDEAALALVFAIKSYLALENYDKAKHYLENYETYCLSEKDHRKIDGGLAPYYIYKGNYYLGIGNIDSAEYCFRHAMPEMHLLHNDVAVYRGLQKVYDAKHQADSVLKYCDLYGRAKERSYASDIARSTADAKNLYDYSVEQKIARSQTERLSHLKDIVYTITLIVLVILTVLGTIYYNERKQTRRLHSQLGYKEKKLEKFKNRLQELRELEKTLRSKQKEAQKQHKDEVKGLASQLKVALEEKEGLSQSVLELNLQIAQLRHELGIKNMGSKAQTLENTEIVRQIKDFLEQPRGHILESQWKSLADAINNTHPDFFNQMNRYHSLNVEEYRVCLLTLIGCSSRDINVLMNKSSGYASNCKKRLHQMVFNQTGTARDFANKIRKFM